MLSSLLLTLSLLRVGKPPHGPPIPGDVACNAKLLAYEFAVSLQPERDARGLAFCARCIAFAHGFAILSCVSGWPSLFFVPVSTMRVASVMYALMTRGWGCTHQHINSMEIRIP